ncbi:RNA-dependent RNA polymerase [Pseudozyma hubeiensis]|nr:RNA-dependent RNA polymerase [Pseudozyma hubeiensis]
MSDSETESDSFHEYAAANLFDTPGSSQALDGSVSPPDPLAASKPFSSEKAPSWALFREEHIDEGEPDRIFLPIPDAARKQRVKVEQVEQVLEPLQAVPPFEEAESPSVCPVSQTDYSDRSNPQTALPRQYLSPFIVVKSHMRVKAMQKQQDGRLAVPWGVQYCLASLVSFGVFSMDELKITTGINTLRSNSNLASLSALLDPSNQHLLWEDGSQRTVMTRRATDRERQVYNELDRETQMRAESRLNGVIGPPGEEMRSYGGRVLFEGTFVCSKTEQKGGQHCTFGIKLFPPKFGGSCRFARRFGSDSIIRIKLDPIMAKDARRFPLHPKTRDIQQEIRRFLSRKIQIFGREYRPFYCKDETVFYFWVGSAKECHDRPEFDCIWDLIVHHAPFSANAHAPLGKFIQRVQLGLSTSVPASVVDRIEYVDDIFGDPDPETGKAVEMTDGAGCMSLAVARDIAQYLGYDTIPSAFQGRIAGAKGVWYVDPNAERALPGEKQERWIKIRTSQKKINYPENEPQDLSQLVIDLLGPSRTFPHSALSRQIILVMKNNGVPMNTFADMQRAELRAIADEISDWSGFSDAARMRLATVVERLCKVESMKSKRSIDSAEHRAQGMESHVGTKGGDQGLGDDDRELLFGQNGRHLWNGMPVSKHERAYEMLLGGFHPEKCAYLSDLLVDIADLAMKKLISRFAIPVARCAEAMMIPDHTGTLEEGEIQFRFSGENLLDPDTRLRLTHVPEGEVLVTRHPCLLPTDVRKVRAVIRPELSIFKDVVLFSTKGKRSLASLLSGGDYDGDLVRVFWEPKLVEPFKNSDVRYADCPFDIGQVFDRNELKVAEFVQAHEKLHKDERDRLLAEQLVAGAFQPAVHGIYGRLHLYAALEFGTGSEEAIDLAHKFAQALDSQKTGLSIKPQIRIQDSKMFSGDLPDWAFKEFDEPDSKDWFGIEDYGETSTARKNSSRPESVLCALWKEGKKEVGLLKQKLQSRSEKLRGVEDTDISGVWRQAKSLGRIGWEVEETIRTQVKVSEESYVRTNSNTRQKIEAKNRDVRYGTATSSTKGKRGSHSVPLRRVRSEAPKAMPTSATTTMTSAVDDLHRDDMSDRLDGTIEVPAVLGSANEVASRFCEWPRAFAKEHIAKMDRLEVERLEKLRASYAYSVTYHSKPRFAFEMAWKWIMNLKAEACGQQQSQGSGSLQVPTSTLDLMSLRAKIIRRNHEMSQGRGVEM